MSITKCLREEHIIIAKVLDCFDVYLLQARKKNTIIKENILPFIEFFIDYIDGCHRLKEEKCLFNCLEKYGFSQDTGSIKNLLEDHKTAKRRVKILVDNLDEAQQGDKYAIQAVLKQGQAFRDLLRSHIFAEDKGLFDKADEAVTEKKQIDILLSQYAEKDDQPENQESNTRCELLAQQIIKEYGV